MTTCVDMTFDCLPLRSIERFDPPLDASEEEEAMCERVRLAAEKHGLHNAYYLHNGACQFRLTNHDEIGMLRFAFEGTLLTDVNDQKTLSADLAVTLRQETCDWLTEPIVDWFAETVRRAAQVEFDRYINAGDLEKAIQRMEELQAESDAHGGFLGMGL